MTETEYEHPTHSPHPLCDGVDSVNLIVSDEESFEALPLEQYVNAFRSASEPDKDGVLRLGAYWKSDQHPRIQIVYSGEELRDFFAKMASDD